MIITRRVTEVWCDTCKRAYVASTGYDYTVQEARDSGWDETNIRGG